MTMPATWNEVCVCVCGRAKKQSRKEKQQQGVAVVTAWSNEYASQRPPPPLETTNVCGLRGNAFFMCQDTQQCVRTHSGDRQGFMTIHMIKTPSLYFTVAQDNIKYPRFTAQTLFVGM